MSDEEESDALGTVDEREYDVLSAVGLDRLRAKLDARNHDERMDGLRWLRTALDPPPPPAREAPPTPPPERDGAPGVDPPENDGENDGRVNDEEATEDPPGPSGRVLDHATVVRLFHGCSASLANALSDPHPGVHAEACLAVASMCNKCTGESMRSFSPWVAKRAWPVLVSQLSGPRLVSDRAHMCMVSCLRACRDPSIVSLVADTMDRINNPLARQRLLDKVSRVLGDWPSGSLLNACKPHCERAIDAGLKHGGLPDDGAPTAVTRLGEPRRRVEMFGGIHGDGGGGVVETDVAGADSHPSNVAVRVAAKAAFDVFEAVWPKHAATWVEEGMEPRWRRLVTHGSLETPEESGAYARGGYPAVGRRESAPLAAHRREEKFAERQRIKNAANRSGVRDPDASDDVDARRLTVPGNFQDGKLPFQPPYPPLPTKPKHGLRERAMHPPQPQPKPLWTGDPPSPVKRAIDADIEKDKAARNKPLAAYYEAVRKRGSMSAKECGDFLIDPNDITKTAEEAMLYRDLEKLETRMETLRANSMGARVYDMYAEAYYRPGGATESSEVSAAAKVARDREATTAARRKMGYDISDVGVVQRAMMDAEALGINAGIVPGHSKDAAGRLRRITTPSLESLRTAGVGMKTPPKVSLATARMLGLPTERIASPGTKGIDEHGLTPSRTMEERVRNLARIRAELKEFRRDLNDAAKVETGPYKDHAADANDAAFKREVSAANKEGDELKSRKAAAKLNVEKHRIDHERKVKALARENLEFEEMVFREAEDERIRKEAEHAAELKALAFKARMESEMRGTYALSAEELLKYPGPPNRYELTATSHAADQHVGTNKQQPQHLDPKHMWDQNAGPKVVPDKQRDKGGPKAWGQRDKSPAAARAEKARAEQKERERKERSERRRSRDAKARVQARIERDRSRSKSRERGGGGDGTGEREKDRLRVSWDENLERTKLFQEDGAGSVPSSPTRAVTEGKAGGVRYGKPATSGGFDARPLREKVPIGRSY